MTLGLPSFFFRGLQCFYTMKPVEKFLESVLKRIFQVFWGVKWLCLSVVVSCLVLWLWAALVKSVCLSVFLLGYQLSLIFTSLLFLHTLLSAVCPPPNPHTHSLHASFLVPVMCVALVWCRAQLCFPPLVSSLRQLLGDCLQRQSHSHYRSVFVLGCVCVFHVCGCSSSTSKIDATWVSVRSCVWWIYRWDKVD